MQTHSAFKHFRCERCNKSFALKSYLNKHYESSCFKDAGKSTPTSSSAGANNNANSNASSPASSSQTEPMNGANNNNLVQSNGSLEGGADNYNATNKLVLAAAMAAAAENGQTEENGRLVTHGANTTLTRSKVLQQQQNGLLRRRQ